MPARKPPSKSKPATQHPPSITAMTKLRCTQPWIQTIAPIAFVVSLLLVPALSQYNDLTCIECFYEPRRPGPHNHAWDVLWAALEKKGNVDVSAEVLAAPRPPKYCVDLCFNISLAMVLQDMDAVFRTNAPVTRYDFRFDNERRPVEIEVQTDSAKVSDIAIDKVTLEGSGGWALMLTFFLITTGLMTMSLYGFWMVWKMQSLQPVFVDSDSRAYFCCNCRAESPANNNFCFNCGEKLEGASPGRNSLLM